MKKFLFLAGITFAVTLAVVMGTRMSADATAVVVGIVCGVLASVPTTIMLVWVLRQREKQETTQWGQRAMSHFPPVIVVNGQGTNGYNGAFPAAPALAAGSAANGPRQFKVVGQENTETIGDVLPAFWDEL
jgi:hypothetical protein